MQGAPQQYPPQQYPPQQYPPQQYPPQQYPPQQYPPQQYPPQQYPPGQYPPQQYPPGQYPPQGYPPQAAPKKKGWERLERDSIFIRQQFQLLAAASGCIPPSVFKIFPLGKDGEKRGKALFKAKEESGCCSRQCMSADCRPFVMKVKLDDDDEELDNENFLLIDRPCKCTVLCFNRPVITINCVQDGKDTYIGKVVNPWTLCNVVLDIFDKDNTHKYVLEASCCQLGFHCKWPCEACQTIDFDIKTPSGEVISTLQKKSSCGGAILGVDFFTVHFPKNAPKEDKALIMAATLFADYRFFEQKDKKGAGGM